MESIFVLLLVIAALMVGYPLYQSRRERELAKRLERLNDPILAALEVDRAIMQSRSDADALKTLGRFNDTLF